MPFRPAVNIAVVALVAMLAACHPVDTWRSITGTDKDDPNPETTPNSQNLAAGEKEPYPNLATVPASPVPTMTQAEREKLTESLVADRTNAKYNEEKLLPGFSPGGEPPPPPPGPGPSAATRPMTPTPNGRPPNGAVSGPAPAGSAAKAAPPPARKPGEPPQPGPMESSLQPPTIKEQPVAEATRPTPPPAQPTIAPAPTPAPSALPSTAMATATPQPPPPPPSIAPVSPPLPPMPARPTPAALEAKPAGGTAATIDFPSATANFTQGDRAAIDKVAAQFQQKPGVIHIKTYAAAASSGRSQLDAYRDALDRGQAVAKALAGDGVPVGKIQTEAAPSHAGAPSGRVLIQLAP